MELIEIVEYRNKSYAIIGRVFFVAEFGNRGATYLLDSPNSKKLSAVHCGPGKVVNMGN